VNRSIAARRRAVGAKALFFAGLSTKLEGETAQRVILVLGCLTFLAALIWMATLPVQLAT
jgi:hypothetical protein